MKNDLQRKQMTKY